MANKRRAKATRKSTSNAKEDLNNKKEEIDSKTPVIEKVEGSDQISEDSDEIDAEMRLAVASASSAMSKIFGWDKTGSQSSFSASGKIDSEKATEKSKTKQKNALTKLIPGYTAPLRLNSSDLDKYNPGRGDISTLVDKAVRFDKSTSNAVISSGSQGVMAKAMLVSNTSSGTSFQKGPKKVIDTTAGKGWFHMQPTTMTDQLKTDMKMIKMRNYIDPKRFYKSADGYAGKVVQVGTVIEGADEFYSNRLTNKERRMNFTEEIMADRETTDYTKSKFQKLQAGKKRPHKKQSRSANRYRKGY